MTDDEYVEYDSGPFCRHFGDPGDCEECRNEDALRNVYRERAHLVAFLTRMFESHWSEDTSAMEWKVACVHTPAGQLTWHISPDDSDLFELEPGPNHWDGHTTEEKYRRLGEIQYLVGTVLTEPQLDKLVAEAEAGYDVEKLKKKKGGGRSK